MIARGVSTAREFIRLRSRLLELRALQQPMHAAQFSQGLVGLPHLALEQGDLPQALFRRHLQGVLARASRLRLDHLADLGKREAELLALEDERKPVAVRAAEDALAALTHRREQATALIEAQRTQRGAKLLGKIRDAEFA